MTDGTMSPGQKAVEDRFGQIKNRQIDPERNAAEQFGEMDAWTFTLGEYRLFLNPMTQRWYFYDRAHDYWKDIDAPAGTVIFSLQGTDLVLHKTGQDASTPPADTPSTGTGRRFCQQCGVPLKPGLKFCSSCGARTT